MWNCLEPFSTCLRYSKVAKGYVEVPQPYINEQYNDKMGGVDLVDNSEKNYAIVTRTKKWYWPLVAWFLNIIMVQAWRLYRAHKKQEALLVQERDNEELEAWEKVMQESGVYSKAEISARKKEKKKDHKKRRNEEKKHSEMPLLEFIRQVVEITVSKHTESKQPIITQREATEQLGPVAAAGISGTGRLSTFALETIRYDSGRHLPKLTKVKGVCKECKLTYNIEKRSLFRCVRCKVALHPECFYNFHTPLEEREEDD